MEGAAAAEDEDEVDDARRIESSGMRGDAGGTLLPPAPPADAALSLRESPPAPAVDADERRRVMDGGRERLGGRLRLGGRDGGRLEGGRLVGREGRDALLGLAGPGEGAGECEGEDDEVGRASGGRWGGLGGEAALVGGELRSERASGLVVRVSGGGVEVEGGDTAPRRG